MGVAATKNEDQHPDGESNAILESKNKYRKIVQAGIASWVRDFQAGKIKIETVDDLRKLIDMDLELQRDEL